MVKHTQTIRRQISDELFECLTILWDWHLKDSILQFVERYSSAVTSDSPETLQTSCLSGKCLHQELGETTGFYAMNTIIITTITFIMFFAYSYPYSITKKNGLS